MSSADDTTAAPALMAVVVWFFYHCRLAIRWAFPVTRAKEVALKGGIKVAEGIGDISEGPFAFILSGASVCPLDEMVDGQAPLLMQVLHCHCGEMLDSMMIMLDIWRHQYQRLGCLCGTHWASEINMNNQC